MNYDFLICGLRVRFELPWSVVTTDDSRPFLLPLDTPGKPDLSVRFCAVDRLILPETGGIWHVDSYYITEGNQHRSWHCPIRGEEPYCCVIWDDNLTDMVSCCYVRGSEHRIAYTRNLLSLLGLESFLLRFDACILHASLIDWQGGGILFCAPSGTGKSTQADLWQRYTLCQILNGDRAGIRCNQGIWTAWGLPFAGTSGIYRNESVPIRALVLLCQGEENSISPVTPLEAFKRMLPECSVRRWDGRSMERLVRILSALVNAVPIYQMECLPDVGAVELLRDTILKEK